MHHWCAGSKDKVPCQRGLNGIVCGCFVTSFTDKNDVWVLSKVCSQNAREGQIDLWVDLSLTDALEFVLDRILNGEDVLVRRVDFRERRVERRGLSGASRSTHEDDTVRLSNEVSKLLECAVAHTDAVETEDAPFLEDPHDDAFTMPDGEDSKPGGRSLCQPSVFECGRLAGFASLRCSAPP